MRSRVLAPSAALLLAAGALAGCASFDPGPRTTDDRPVADVRAVVLDTSGELGISVGAEPALTVTAGEALIGRLTSEVVDGVLTLGVEGAAPGWNGPIRYDLTVTSLESLTVLGSGDAKVDFAGARTPVVEVRGSGDVVAGGIDAETATLTVDGSGEIEIVEAKTRELTVRIDGSGGVEIDGVTEHQDVSIRGSGDYRAEALRSATALVTIGGSGDAAVQASDELDAELDGSGSVYYDGDPAVTKKVSGSGDVERR